MKILFAVQGTGNGHISRARMMAKHLQSQPNIDTTYLFSGRARKDFFDMEIFGDFLHRRGLTFHSQNGRVSYFKTLTTNNSFQFLREVYTLDLSAFDLVVCDFEPVAAWAARLRGKPIIGLGHQYAFAHDAPRAGSNFIADLVMRYFAPANESLGLHWHHFNAPILPPIIDPSLTRTTEVSNKIVVYLPFEDQARVQKLLLSMPDYHFVIYAPELRDDERSNLSLRKTSHTAFKRDLMSANGVICNAGFELISECLHLGLAVLAKPQGAQMEQLSNAAALQQLGYASTMVSLDQTAIRNWLDSIEQPDQALRVNIHYPDVAKSIVEWIADGRRASINSLSERLWRETTTNE